jgi:hypothetical protein
VQYVNEDGKRKLMQAVGYVDNPEWVEPASACVASIDCSGGTSAVQPDASITIPGVPDFYNLDIAKLWAALKAKGFDLIQIVKQIVKERCGGFHRCLKNGPQ